MSTESLYIGPDRGCFRAIRIPVGEKSYMEAHCRIRNATVHNYITTHHYAVVSYEIEYWTDRAPYEGGQTTLFRPYNRPNISKLCFRTKASNTSKMLYLEDAIINDFLSDKLMVDAMVFKSVEQELANQIELAKVWTPFKDDPDAEYRQAIHITSFSTTATTPLTLQTTSLSFSHRTGGTGNGTLETIPGYVFTDRRSCLAAMAEAVLT